MTKQYTAWQVVSSNELYHKVYTVPGSKKQWECVGLSRTERRVKFSRLVPLPGMKIRVVSVYLRPDDLVTIVHPDDYANE